MININHIYFGYNRHKDTLADLSLSLEKGRVHGILGCNGVGKSTLMKIMSGLLLPGKGSLTVGVHNPVHRRPSFFREAFLIPEDSTFHT